MKDVKYVFNKYDSIDVLANNAGIGFAGRCIEEQTPEEWNRINQCKPHQAIPHE